MPGVSLSRWTMSYFAAALLCLIGAEALMTAGFGFPRAPLQAPQTLILVHLVAIGWLSLLMCGALLQFVPVLVAQPLHSQRLALPALVLLVGGLIALVLGFLQLAGEIAPGPPLLPIGGVLLAAGFVLVLWNLACTLKAASARTLPARFVIVALASLVATLAFGIVFAFVLGGATRLEPLLALTPAALPLHVVAGLGGWLTFAAVGVTYRLLAMFMLAPELERRGARAVLYLGAASLALAILGGAAAILLGHRPGSVLLAAAAAGLAALALYGRDVRHLYRARKRPNLELNSRMATLAFASLGAAVVLMLALLGLGRLGDHIGALVFLIAFGWLTGLGLSQLYKITAFLTWLECYGPVLGKAATPRVQDLVSEGRTKGWFWLYFAAVWAGALALMLGQEWAFRACAAAMLAATAGILVQLVRTRRLVNVEAARRLPQGARRPGLLLAHIRT